ncbi:MAG: hypothetical protein AB200_00140 [Parcubacteria bacterium C7867-005]|nr:MAG: hypothetical protein AB200_00140 [Parcubacteria bacterium C7867-005]
MRNGVVRAGPNGGPPRLISPDGEGQMRRIGRILQPLLTGIDHIALSLCAGSESYLSLSAQKLREGIHWPDKVRSETHTCLDRSDDGPTVVAECLRLFSRMNRWCDKGTIIFVTGEKLSMAIPNAYLERIGVRNEGFSMPLEYASALVIDATKLHRFRVFDHQEPDNAVSKWLATPLEK